MRQKQIIVFVLDPEARKGLELPTTQIPWVYKVSNN